MEQGSLDAWFMEEVLVLEPVLLGYLRRRWSDAAEIADLRQEVFARVYQAARRERPRNVAAFVFMTAHNLLIDRRRRAKVVSIDVVADLDAAYVAEDEPTAEDRLSSRQELALLRRALDALPDRCREIVVLRKVQGRSQREVARLLGVTESTVEKNVSRGVRRLAETLYGEGGAFEGDVTGRARAVKGDKP